MIESKREPLLQWARAQLECVFELTQSGRRIETALSPDALIEAIERSEQLHSGARTLQVLALTAAGEERARIDVRIDPKAAQLAAAGERELATREASATAAAIAATDHRSVQVTIKALADQGAESHRALIGMMSAFGKSAGEVLASHAKAVESIDARASRAESRVAQLEEQNDKLRNENRELLDMVRTALDEAERAKNDSNDLVMLLRATFGPKVDEVLRGFAARAAAATAEVPS